ncbi:ROK family protein [Mycoplasmopsis gallopavonis]|uniref:N-acetylmannosamine kinase n=1 Tax=Mycoplasmopsis gallopavonis TaxID=76629 RepID=A0A449B026_9BACT|nr:ROK family protein [Mycoplasmopsis gallopavonis]RIV16291.1 ROK family protein [Mycoplasmopsis gallopavonis]VEU73120.1 N-acetylmannosamine kinase [Mycoplasmopsis gallopavonis]
MNNNLKNNFAAVDIGGTNIRFALFDQNGQIILKEKTQTNYHDAQQNMNWIIEHINFHKVNFLALSIPGPSDYTNGIVLKSPNLGPTWENLDIKNLLLNKTNLKDIVFENDANAMAYANHKIHNLDSQTISQFYTISTGFGAGLVIDGKVYHGNKYYAQEIAQLPISRVPFLGKHRLKNPFALELHCSGTGIATKAQFYKIGTEAKEVFQLAKENNVLAQKIIDEAEETLARMFAISAGTIAPHYFFVGGSVALNAKFLIQNAFNKAKEWSDSNHFNEIKLIFDKLGDDSALVGLYHLIKDKN